MGRFMDPDHYIGGKDQRARRADGKGTATSADSGFSVPGTYQYRRTSGGAGFLSM